MPKARTALSKRPRAPKKMEVAARRAKVLELRISGLSMRAIARQVDVHPSTVQADLDAELASLAQDTDRQAKHLRSLMDAQLVGLWAELWAARMVRGKVRPEVIDRLLRVQESRRKLWGLDAPEVVEVHTGLADQVAELESVPDDLVDALAESMGVTPALPAEYDVESRAVEVTP